jgi:hypothetical protein
VEARLRCFFGQRRAALHPMLWLNLVFDFVDAQLRLKNTPLPRIPPGRAGLASTSAIKR